MKCCGKPKHYLVQYFLHGESSKKEWSQKYKIHVLAGQGVLPNKPKEYLKQFHKPVLNSKRKLDLERGVGSGNLNFMEL